MGRAAVGMAVGGCQGLMGMGPPPGTTSGPADQEKVSGQGTATPGGDTAPGEDTLRTPRTLSRTPCEVCLSHLILPPHPPIPFTRPKHPAQREEPQGVNDASSGEQGEQHHLSCRPDPPVSWPCQGHLPGHPAPWVPAIALHLSAGIPAHLSPLPRAEAHRAMRQKMRVQQPCRAPRMRDATTPQPGCWKPAGRQKMLPPPQAPAGAVQAL